MTVIAAAFPEPDPDRDPMGPVQGSAPAAGSPRTGAVFGLDERASLELCVADPSACDVGTVVEFLVRVQAEESRWAAKRVRLLADLAARDSSEDRWVAEEVGAALRWSPARAMRAVKEASQLHDQLPRMFERLAAGAVTEGQARRAVEASYRLPDRDAVARLDQAAATHCGEQSEPQTRRFLSREVLRVDPAGAERRHRRAVQERYVRLTAAEDGDGGAVGVAAGAGGGRLLPAPGHRRPAAPPGGPPPDLRCTGWGARVGSAHVGPSPRRPVHPSAPQHRLTRERPQHSQRR